MPVDVIMPPLSQTMDTVVLVEWLKQVGEAVTKGETLFMVETDKATLEVEAPASGTLAEILAEPGREVPVKSRIGTITLPGESTVTGPARAAAPIPPAAAAGLSAAGRPARPPERQARIFASPRARRLAAARGVPLARLRATGPQQMIVERDVQAYLAREAQEPAPLLRPRATPLARRVAAEAGLDLQAVQPAQVGGRITRADVELALGRVPEEAPEAAAAAAAPAQSRLERLSGLRRTIARRMQLSHQTTAPVTLTRTVDATELKLLRERVLGELAATDVRPTYTDFLVKILAHSLRRHPYMNAHLAGEEAVELFEQAHIGVAVDTERGLVVPVLHDVGTLGLLELAARRARLVQRALDGVLTPEELAAGTFTLTNLGSLGVDAFTPLLNPPQVGILGVGRIHPVPAVHEGQVAIREQMFLSLTFDHRSVDGGPAARFLQDVVRLIEKPHLIWL